MKCVLYARVSTDKQAEKDLSIPAQLQAMRDHARQQGWTVVEEFMEPGMTATNADRPAFQQMLARITDGTLHVDLILCHKLNRFARNIEDYIRIRAALRKQGVRLVYVVEKVDDSPSGQLLENVMASMAQFDSTNLSEEVKKGMRQKVLQGGWPHRPPRGYALVRAATSRENAIEIHPKDGPLMKRAFELYASGWYSVRTLANRLAKEGLAAKNGFPIPNAHLRRLLGHSFYAGFVRWHDLECPGTHPALVPRALFDQVQDVIRRRFKNPGPKGSAIAGFPLRGLAICAGCRGRMTAERHRRWGYYRCSRQTFRRELCAAKMCNATRAHAALERICKGIKLNPQLAKDIATAAQSSIDARIRESRQRRERVEADAQDLLNKEMTVTAAFTAGDVSPNDYRDKIATVRAKRGELARITTTAPETPDRLRDAVSRILQLATSCWDLYEPLNDVRRAGLLREVFKTVVLDQEGITGFTLNAPFDELMKPTASPRSTAQVAEALVSAA